MIESGIATAAGQSGIAMEGDGVEGLSVDYQIFKKIWEKTICPRIEEKVGYGWLERLLVRKSEGESLGQSRGHFSGVGHVYRKTLDSLNFEL
jgi:hypothetical protein